MSQTWTAMLVDQLDFYIAAHLMPRLEGLTDEEYFYNKFDLTAFGQPTLEGQPGPPQEWYVQFTRNFN